MNTLIEVKKKTIGPVLVFELSGELDETNADKTFTAIYAEIGEFAGKKLVLNLAGLKYLNSKSIGYIADIFNSVEDAGGAMCLCHLGEEVKDTLELVGITSIVPVTETEALAIAALDPTYALPPSEAEGPTIPTIPTIPTTPLPPTKSV